MKTNALIAVVAFFLGVAVTLANQWLLQGSKEDPSPRRITALAPRKAKSERTTASVAGRPGKSGRAPVALQRAAEGAQSSPDPESTLARRQFRDKWVEDLKDRHRNFGEEEIDARLALWVERLGLSDPQMSRLRKLMRQHLEESLERPGAEDGMGMLNPSRPSHDESQGAELDALFDALLSADQKEAYETLKEEQEWNEIDARAMRQLAGLQRKLNVSEEQRERLFEILHSREAARGQNPPAIKDDYRAFLKSGGTIAEWSEHREEEARIRRQEEIAPMRGVLNDRQLGVYREYLEQRRPVPFPR